MKRKYTAVVEIVDDCIDIVAGKTVKDKPLNKLELIGQIECSETAGLKITVIRDSFKRIPVKKKKTEGQIAAARRRSGKIAADGPSKDFTTRKPLERFTRRVTDT